MNPSEICSAPVPESFPDTPARPVYSGAERIMAAVSLAAGFLWVRLCLYHESGIFTTLLGMAFLTVMVVFLKKNGATFTKSEKLTLVVLYGFTLVYTVTANALLKGLATVYWLVTAALFLLHTANPDGDLLRFLPVSFIRSCLEAPFRNGIAALGALTSGAKTSGFWKKSGYIAIGLLLAVPAAGIAGGLLYRADDNMAHLLHRLLHLPTRDMWVLLPHLLLGILFGSMAFSAVYTAEKRGISLDRSACSDAAKSCRLVPNLILYAMATPLCLLYVLFFFSQLQYFLGGFTGSTEGMTYAEYARRGFFELCGVCTLNLFVIGGMGFFAKCTGTEKPPALRLFSGFLCISSLLLSGTAIAKMLLYIRIYGMTRLRIYTTWFMLLLAAAFLLLLLRQFLPQLNLGKGMAVIFTVMFALLCFSRPDAWITRCNAEMYLSGQLEQFDDSVLSTMSTDAWAALTAYDSQTVNRLLLRRSEEQFACLKQFVPANEFWAMTNLSAWELMLYEYPSE